ncbi:MAG TPA: hypothetical protein VMJ10_06805 [Kofleriaceae bacterium]|nr:hypothetical protein [Kofleriaceae bacterium]
MSPTSDLATLVAAEARLDGALADARVAADAVVELARRAAASSDTEFEADLARERARLAAEISARTAAELRAIEDDARADVARFEAMRGDALVPIAHALVRRLVELVREDVP